MTKKLKNPKSNLIHNNPKSPWICFLIRSFLIKFEYINIISQQNFATANSSLHTWQTECISIQAL